MTTLYKTKFLNTVFLFAGIVAFVMAFVRLQTNLFMGIADFIFAFACFSLIFYLKKDSRDIEKIASIAIFLCYILFTLIYIFALENTTRVVLFFLLLAAVFFLKGSQVGNYWLIIIVMSLVLPLFFITDNRMYSVLDVFVASIYLVAFHLIFKNYELVRVKQEKELINLNNDLNQKVTERTQELESALQVKSNFLANMSHEIRTPMNGVIGIAELLDKTALSVEQKEYVGIIKKSGSGLITVINDILDFSKIEAGKLDLHKTEFPLSQLLKDIHQIFNLQCEQKNIAFVIVNDLDINLNIFTDEHRLKQVLINLVNNAYKFTEKGRITLNVVTDTNADLLNTELVGTSTFEFSIKDTGIGIPKNKLEKLFLSFSQLDTSTTREYGGTGLGLAISQQLVELMGGKIGVFSSIDKGSIFWFKCPFEFSIKQPVTVIETKKDQIKTKITMSHKKILVVDDNKINRVVAVKVLSQLGYQSDTANNGVDAIELIQNHHYDLIFMDCHMPVMDGYEATKAIRINENNEKKSSHLCIIAMTANVLEGEREKCLDSGMDDYLTKPFKPSDITSIFEKWHV